MVQRGLAGKSVVVPVVHKETDIRSREDNFGALREFGRKPYSRAPFGDKPEPGLIDPMLARPPACNLDGLGELGGVAQEFRFN